MINFMFLKRENMFLCFTHLIYISNSTSPGMKVDIAIEKLYKNIFFLIFSINLCENDWFCAFLST